MINNSNNQKDDTSLDLVVFKAGEFLFGVETAWIKSSGILPEYTIPEIESLLSLPVNTVKSGRHCLRIKSGSHDYEISVATPLDLHSLPVANIHPLPTAIVARCKLPGLRALALLEDKVILLIEPHSVTC